MNTGISAINEAVQESGAFVRPLFSELGKVIVGQRYLVERALIGLARAFKPLLPPGASIVTLTYDAAQKVVPHYNVMGVAKAALEASTRYLAHDLGKDGIRVNAISAGPVKTLAAAGIAGFRSMLADNAERTPLRRNIDQEDVARAALYLCSDLAKNVTGEILHVDAGQNIMAPVTME